VGHRRRLRSPRLHYSFRCPHGRFAWRFYVIPAPVKKATKPARDTWKLARRALDDRVLRPRAESYLLGTGNASSDLNSTRRRGDNLYTASIVALDADTGKLRWHYQEVPQDAWITTLPTKSSSPSRNQGAMRKVLIHPTKTGYAGCSTAPTANSSRLEVRQECKLDSGITESGKLVGRREAEPGKPASSVLRRRRKS